MLSERMEKALTEQLAAELYSGYLYLSMATYFSAENLPGFANWMRIHRLEEITHGMKFYNFIESRGGRIRLGAIDAPPSDWESPIDAFEAVLSHERKVTGMIHDLVNLASEEKDHGTSSFLQWFVDEQVEEEESAQNVINNLNRVKDAPGGIYMLDKEMGVAVFNPQPTGIAGGVG
ncbi:MAG: ferritin [Actinobacteria bacterium]|nr:ferritin [Actinomycetota bacterium]